MTQDMERREDLLTNNALVVTEGRVPMRELRWHCGHMDGELEEDSDIPPPLAVCRLGYGNRRPCDEDDDEEERGNRSRDTFTRISRRFDGRSKPRPKAPERNQGSGWYRGESLRLRQICNQEIAGDVYRLDTEKAEMTIMSMQEGTNVPDAWMSEASDAIHIIPVEDVYHKLMQHTANDKGLRNTELEHNSAVIVIPLQEHITPTELHKLQLLQQNKQSVASNSEFGQEKRSNDTAVSQHQEVPSLGTASDMPPNQADPAPIDHLALVNEHSPITAQPEVSMTAVSSAQKNQKKQTAANENTAVDMLFQKFSPEGPLNHNDQANSNTELGTQDSANNEPPTTNDNQDPVTQFKQSITSMLPSPILQAPTTKLGTTTSGNEAPTSPGEMRNPRLKSNGKQKPVMWMAQELIAKKWGVLQPEQDLESRTLQVYLDKYKEPLTEEKMEAIKTLSAVAAKKKSKKNKMAVGPAPGKRKKKKTAKEDAVMMEV